ncbi:unnamed protein product [Nesidiocoris tenuis]|uniref:G-protein coupled receptors family 1 profile domain-containing protein n=1 Tax=Nesidiocoris tenuis TaxID=355587 RepID=A0A6H5FUB0_9HEMI|nr:unnamed protein product [Nesidiocoris tenuis]
MVKLPRRLNQPVKKEMEKRQHRSMYLAIAAPLHYSSLVGPRKVLFIGAIAWLTTFTLALLPLTFTGFEPVESPASAGSGGAGGIEPEIQPSVTTPSSINIGYVCRPPVFCVVGGFAFVLFYTLITFLLPVGIVIFCNVNVSDYIYSVTLFPQNSTLFPQISKFINFPPRTLA